MAKITSYTDDTDGSEGAIERSFSIGDIEYLIDLTDANWGRFLQDLEYWRTRARIKRKDQIKLNEQEKVDIRRFAEIIGRPLPQRGRFPDSIKQAYFDWLGSQETEA